MTLGEAERIAEETERVFAVMNRLGAFSLERSVAHRYTQACRVIHEHNIKIGRVRDT